jgi:hypothetical protein
MGVGTGRDATQTSFSLSLQLLFFSLWVDMEGLIRLVGCMPSSGIATTLLLARGYTRRGTGKSKKAGELTVE